MEFRSKALASLRKAEGELRMLMRQAGDGGDYASVVQIAAWAQSIGELVGDGEPSKSLGDKSAAVTSRRHTAPVKAAARVASKSSVKQPRAAVDDAGYPKFFRQGDQLLKVGWSRRLREEYHHKASQRAVELVVAAIASAGRDGKLFAPDDFIPVSDPADRCDIPVYQVYVTLAWLKEMGIVEMHGRSGYTLRDQKDPSAAARLSWGKLAQRT